VMNDKWTSSKETRALINEDIKARQHVPVERKRQSTDVTEKGFLVIGFSAITFLASDNSSIVLSHPLNFIEMYSQSLHNPCDLSYTVKQTHFLKKDAIMSFTFSAQTNEVVQSLVRELDRFVMARIREDPQGMPQSYVLDHTRQHEVRSEETVNYLAGERFVCERQYIAGDGPSLINREKRQETLAIFHARGVAFLTNNGEKDDGRGILDAFSYPKFLSFGAADDSTFGFRVTGATAGRPEEEEVFICLYSEGSADLMNVLVTRHAKVWSELKKQGLDEVEEKAPAHWPREYTTKDFGFD